MAKLTKRDIVVAISNQTGMVQHQVFDIVQRTLDKITDSLANNVPAALNQTAGGTEPQSAGQQFRYSVARNCEIQSWQSDAPTRRKTIARAKRSGLEEERNPGQIARRQRPVRSTSFACGELKISIRAGVEWPRPDDRN